MNLISIPISYGELVDKITILEIKLERISDRRAIENIQFEYYELKKIYENLPDIDRLYNDLKKINEEQWDVQDALREQFIEAEQRIDEYAELAIKVGVTNVLRYEYKREINLLLSSCIVEEKIYRKKDEKS